MIFFAWSIAFYVFRTIMKKEKRRECIEFLEKIYVFA